jgi:sensory rhodopsin
MDLINIVLLAGSFLFIFSSLFFYFFHKSEFKSAFFVSFVTLGSYLLMLEGSFAQETLTGEPIHWTRWIAYAASCSLLMYTIGQKLEFNSKKIANLIYLTVLVMVAGAISAIFTGNFMLMFFIFSSIAYVMLISPVLKDSGDHPAIKYFILLGWTLFPVVFLLSPAGYGVITTSLAFVGYIILDFFTKIIFYLVVDRENLKI